VTLIQQRRLPIVRRWFRPAGVFAVVVLFTVELALGWPALVTALRQVRTPHVGWLGLAVAAELAAMSAYALMQRRLLRSAGVRTTYREHARLAYAAHSLNETLPGGPAFSTRLNYQQMRRFGASPAIASWAIALSGILSTTALAAITVGGALATGGGAAQWPHLLALLAVTALIILGVRRLARHPETAGAVMAVVNRVRRRPASEGSERIIGFFDQLRAARLRPAHGLAVVAFALVNWLVDAVALWLCFLAVGEHPATPSAVLLAFCTGMAAGSVTVVPGGLGVIDSTLIFGLVAGGTALPAAVAVVVLYRIVSFGFIIGLGWLSWLRLRADAVPALAPSPAPAGTAPGPRSRARLLSGCPHRSRASEQPALTSRAGELPALTSRAGELPALASRAGERQPPALAGAGPGEAGDRVADTTYRSSPPIRQDRPVS
jgi:uncharacterized membrane protein YbhN (UPF0104 family)